MIFSLLDFDMKFSDGVDVLTCHLAMARPDFRFEGINLKQIAALITNFNVRNSVVLYFHIKFDIWTITIG